VSDLAAGVERESDRALILQLAEARRASTDDRMWAVPALSLTALAFLLTAVLNPKTSWGARTVALAVGAVVLLVALIQMLKHRYHEVLLSRWLSYLEEQFGIPRLHDLRDLERATPPPQKRDPLLARRNGELRRYIEFPAYRVWAVLLMVLLVADVAALGASLGLTIAQLC
jgi:hypothetical protein